MFDFEDNSIIIIPNTIKVDFIKNIREKNNKLNIKIFSLDEFIKLLTYDYNEETIYEVMNIYKVNYNIATLYLENIKYIYNSDDDRIKKLIDVKKSIEPCLIIDKLFLKIIKDRNIYVYGYDYISKYDLSILNSIDKVIIIKKEYNNYIHDVIECNTLEDEVILIAEKICSLLSNNIDINNIFISNLDSKYYYIIEKIFSMYNIPININKKQSIYNTLIGKCFINNISDNIEDTFNKIKEKFDLNNKNNNDIYNKLINVVNKFYFISNKLLVKDNIINVMKNTFILSNKYVNAVNEISIIDNIIDNNKYVFLVGFNLNSIPIIIKDEDYISDNIKSNIMEKSYEMNMINKDIIYNNICSIKNLFISYKLKYLNESFYPSNIINDYNMNVVKNSFNYSIYSDCINKINLTKHLDNLIKFNENNDNLSILSNNYNIKYREYSNKYSGINKNDLYKYLNNKMNLSYTSLDNYYHCSFKFYLSNILKLDIFETTLQAYIGNVFHYILSKAFLDNFSFEESFNHFINNNPFEMSEKNKYFINSLKPDMLFVIDVIKKQNTFNNMDKYEYEKKISVEKINVLNITFKGFIDKIISKKNIVSIIDYKTYDLDINLDLLPYGLCLQLPIYLYLAKTINRDSIVVGFYLQNILSGLINHDSNKTIKEIKMNKLKLKGYSLGEESVLSEWDSEYTNSEYIHGMKCNDKGFGYYTNVLSRKNMEDIVELTDKKIDECISNIENANFPINPKFIDNKNIGCEYCKFKDICFVNNSNYVYIDTKENTTIDK